MEHNYNTCTVSYEKSKMVSFASSIMKDIVVFPAQSRFTVKLICCIAFGSALVLIVYWNLLQSF